MDASRSPSTWSKLTDGLRRAFEEFLKLPTVMAVAGVLLAIGMYLLDRYQPLFFDALSQAVSQVLFTSGSSTQNILSTVAGSLITVTSITFTVLLLAVQQTSGAMTTQIIDQFLRRRLNQIFFGYFVGLALYLLVILATIHQTFNPVLSATLALILTGLALYFLATLVYVTLTQVRPAIVINGIHDGTLLARRRQLEVIQRLRSTPQLQSGTRTLVRSQSDGYAVQLQLHPIEQALQDGPDEVEIVLHLELGDHIAYQDVIAELWTPAGMDTEALVTAVQQSVQLGRARDLDYDPRHGIEEIMNIGWTTMSTSKHSPVTGFHAIDVYRDLLARWTGEAQEIKPAGPPLPIVYHDTTLPYLLENIEMFAMVARESKQVHSFAAVVHLFAVMFDRLPPDLQASADEIICRIIPALKAELLATNLDRALLALAAVLRETGYTETATAVEEARDQMAQSIGKLRSQPVQGAQR